MMSRSAPPGLNQDITALCHEMWARLADHPAASYTELLAWWQEVHNIYLETAATKLAQWAERQDTAGEEGVIDKIEADSITVEIVDKNTGKILRRVFPVKYYETGNGVILSGEALDGTPSRITFFSDTALATIQDLFGQGPDAPRCRKTERDF
ncbi:MAG: hypothetical protein P4N59_09050 [Negativicutes bacterium]|nr:hypothetical protein [Negativicutes bacterium]